MTGKGELGIQKKKKKSAHSKWNLGEGLISVWVPNIIFHVYSATMNAQVPSGLLSGCIKLHNIV